MSVTSSLVSTQWLSNHLGDDNLVVIDGSFKLPGVTPIAQADYKARHIRGARFFDIDAVADHSTNLPHMLLTPEEFATAVAALGISNDSTVIVYDTPGLMSAVVSGGRFASSVTSGWQSSMAA